MELTDLKLSELHDLMGMLGAKYLPSVCYKLRALPFGTPDVQGIVPLARLASAIRD